MTANANPEYEGQCAFAISTGKLGVPGSSKHALADGGRTYYFKNGAARFLWKVLPNRGAKADEAWLKETAA